MAGATGSTRALAFAGAFFLLATILWKSAWLVLDFPLAVVLLAISVRPELVQFIPKGDHTLRWAGARGRGIPAPRDAQLTLPKSSVATLVGTVLFLRVVLAGAQGVWAYLEGTSISAAALSGVGSLLGCVACLFLAIPVEAPEARRPTPIRPPVVNRQ